MFRAMRSLLGFLQRRDLNRRRHAPWTVRPIVECLETRRVLAATNLPAITGTVFADANSDALVDPGEAIQGAIVRLFQDDGDGVFEPGTDDVQVGADVTTDANGEYCFDSLDQDETYFVQQPAQTAGGHNLSATVSSLISITPGLIIDTFETTQSTAALPPPISSDESALGFANENEVIGAERDLAVQLSSGSSEIQLRVNPFGLQDVLLFDSSAGSVGTREITWDGVDADGDTLALGLGGRDLTVGGTLSGITLRMGVDANGANARFRLYQGATTNFSEVTLPIPVTGGAATQWAFVPFADFVGPVTADNVDAIQLILETGSGSVDGQIDVIGALGAQTANFANPVGIDLELTKVADVATVNNGDTVNWTLTLTNDAATAVSSATGVVVEDVVPTGLTLVNAIASDGTFAGNDWTLANPLAPGSSVTLTLETTVDASVAGGTVITNVAEVSAHNETDVDSAPGNDDGDQSEDDEAAASITVNNLIDLELTKSANVTTAAAGDPVTFTLTLTNTSSANTAATNVQVTDTLPAEMTLISATPSGSGTFAGGVWSLVDPLPIGAMQTLVLIAEVNAGTPGNSQLTNRAEVTAADQTDIDSTPGNDDGDQSEDDEAAAAFNVPTVIDLELQKVADVATADVGDTVTWTLTLTNNATNANANATDVQITDVLPAGLTLVTATPSGSGTFAGDVWSLVDPLVPGASATLVLTTQVTGGSGGASIVNSAQVTAANESDFDSTPGNDDGDQSEDDEAADTVTLNARIDLALTKTASTTTANNGDTVSWTLVLTNDAAGANAPATGVTVTDALPSGLTLVNATPSVGTFTGGVWTLGAALAPGDTATLALETTVDDGVAGGTVITNTAQVGAAAEPDLDSSPANDDGDQSEDDESAAQVTINEVIDLAIEKTNNLTTADVGDTVTWTITVTNQAATANTSATGVTVSDILPANVTFVSANTTNGSYDNGTGVWTLTGALAEGAQATLTITATIDPAAAGTTLDNITQVLSHTQSDVDSLPANDDGDQSEDDEDADALAVNIIRPPTKRALLASNFR